MLHEGDVRYSAADAEAMEAKLSRLEAELEMYVAAFGEEKKLYGSMLETTKTALEAIQRQVDAIDSKLDTRRDTAAESAEGPIGLEVRVFLTADRMAALFAKAIKAAA
jgi:hypothetical protein